MIKTLKVILLLIAASITLSAVSYQLNAIAAKDQQIEILKEILKESNDRERGYLRALRVSLEDTEKEID